MDYRRPLRSEGSRIPVRLGKRFACTALGLGVVAVLAQPVTASAQCDEARLRNAAGGASGYQKRDANLCEGIYGPDVSGDVLTFVGLTASEAYEPLQPGVPLQISWSAPPAGNVHLRAQSRKDNFQMDAQVTGAKFDWPLDLLQRENIKVDQVNLLGWVEQPAGDVRLFVPVNAYPAGTEPQTAGGYYTFYIYPNARLSQVSWRLARVDKAGARPGTWDTEETKLRQTEFPVDETFYLDIDHSVFGSAGIYLVEVSAKQADGASDAMSIWFYHGG